MTTRMHDKFYGFTLIEMTMVLALIALLLGAGLSLLSVQQDQRRIDDTRELLESARESLLGYAIANGRLPCPASSTSNGQESLAGGTCTNALNGFLPAVTLGLSGTDSGGYLSDGWKSAQNRIRYAVTTANTNAATSADGIKTITMTNFAPDLHVCDSASGITGTSCGSAAIVANKAVAVIYSLGKNAATGGSGADEAANLNNDAVFVSHSIAFGKDGAAGGEFDDQLIWISPYILFNRMVLAGKLP